MSSILWISGKTCSFLPLTTYCPQLETKHYTKTSRQKHVRYCMILQQYKEQQVPRRYSRGRWSNRWKSGPVARFESTPSRKWISIFDLSRWQLILRAWNSVTGERPWPSWTVTAQISRSRQSSFHSRAYVKMRPVSPGLYRPPSLPLAWPVCPFVTSSTLTHSSSVCSSVCLPSSINLLSVHFTKTPLSPLIFSHPSRLLFLP